MADILRISIIKSNNKIIEMQTHDATYGTLIQNAVGWGHNENDIEEKKVTEEELKVFTDLEINSQFRKGIS